MIKIFKNWKFIKKIEDLYIKNLDDIEIVFMCFTEIERETIYCNFKPFLNEEPMQHYLRTLWYTLQSY